MPSWCSTRTRCMIVLLYLAASIARDSSLTVSAAKLVYRLTPELCQQGYVVAERDVNRSSDQDKSSLIARFTGPSSNTMMDGNQDGMATPWSVACAPSRGIYAGASTHRPQVAHAPAALVSSGTVLDLMRLDQSTDSNGNDEMSGLSFELWLKPALSGTAHSIPVLTIGTKYPNLQPVSSPLNDTTQMIRSVCDDEQKDFQLAIVNATWTVMYRVRRENETRAWDDCRVHTLGPAVTSQLTHVVVVLVPQQFAVTYINGQAYTTRDSVQPRTDWAVNSMGLYVLGYHAVSDRSPLPRTAVPASNAVVDRADTSTTLYQLTVSTQFDAALSSMDVHDLLRQGLPPTRPFAYNQTLVVNEDAEGAPGSHTVDWYRWPSVVSNDTAALGGPLVACLDCEVRSLLTTVAYHPVTATRQRTVVSTYLYLTSLPSTGHLYFHGTPLKQVQSTTAFLLIPLGLDPVTRLDFIPPHNVHSVDNMPVATFQYCVADTAIFHTSQCQSTATIRLFVQAVNDPPVARPVPLTMVKEGLDPIQRGKANMSRTNQQRDKESVPKIPLLGSDVDNDPIQAVEITQAPMHGDLILAVSSFRHDFVPHGTLVSALNFTVHSSSRDNVDGVYVRYRWKPPPGRMSPRQLERGDTNHTSSHLHFAPTVIHGANIMDSFTFRVQDTHGAWSLEERVDLLILSAVTGHVDDSSLVVQEDSVGSIRWWGSDDSGYDRTLRFFVEAVPPPHVGVLWDPVSKTSLQAGFMVTTWSEFPYETGVSIQWRGARNYCHDQGSMLEYDAEIRFRVAAIDGNGAVSSVSDAIAQTILVECAPDVLSLVVPTESVSVLETNLNRAPGSNDGDDEDKHVVVLHGIEISSADHSQHRAERAWVSVSTRTGYLTFDARYWNRTEPIRGRSTWASGTVTFYAYPDDLTAVMTDLRYQSYHAGNDTIVLQVHYGNCASTMAAPSTERVGPCQVMQRSIAVEIQWDPDKYTARTRMVVGFPWQILFCLVAYPVLYSAVVFLEGTFAGDGDDTETVMEGSPLEPVERYVQHEDENGMFYYEDTMTGTVRWDLPPGEEFVHFEEIGQ